MRPIARARRTHTGACAGRLHHRALHLPHAVHDLPWEGTFQVVKHHHDGHDDHGHHESAYSPMRPTSHPGGDVPLILLAIPSVVIAG